MAMPKLKINETEYYTDDFNEEQMSMYREISVAREEMNRMQYLMQVLDGRCNMLGGMIVEIANQEDIKQLPDQDTDDD
jgi:hypothetical protein